MFKRLVKKIKFISSFQYEKRESQEELYDYFIQFPHEGDKTQVSKEHIQRLLYRTFGRADIQEFSGFDFSEVRKLESLYTMTEESIPKDELVAVLKLAILEVMTKWIGLEVHQLNLGNFAGELWLLRFDNDDVIRSYAHETDLVIQMTTDIEKNEHFKIAPYKKYDVTTDQHDAFQFYDRNDNKVRKQPNATIFKQTDRIKMIKYAIYKHFDVGILKEDKIVTDFAPLHNEHTLNKLRAEWANFGSIMHSQPLEDIKLYFGETIAFYFAWLQYYVKWIAFPAILGTFVFLINFVVDKELSSSLNFLFSMFMVLWAMLFGEFWHRQSNLYAVKFGTQGLNGRNEERNEFKGTLKFDPIIEKKVKTYPNKIYHSKIAVSTVVVAFMIYIIVQTNLYIFSIEASLDKKDTSLFMKTTALAILMAVVRKVFDIICLKIASALTRWENHRFDARYENAFLFKLFSCNFVNTYFALFYIAFVKRYFEKCPSCDYLSELSVQVASFCLIDAVLNIVEVAEPIIRIALKTAPKIVTHEKDPDAIKLTSDSNEKFNIAQVTLENFEGVCYEYLELINQYSYSTIFCVTFPLAPLFAFLNNLLEIRVDAVKLCFGFKRPFPERAENIGIASDILTFMSYMAIITNTGILFVTTNIFDISPENKLWVFLLAEHVVILIKYALSNTLSDYSVEAQTIRRRHGFLLRKWAENLAIKTGSSKNVASSTKQKAN